MLEMDSYKLWRKTKLDDIDLSSELAAIDGDTEAIKDRFYRELEFGTGGLRGVIGAGSNRMNTYTVRKATQGLADYLNEQAAQTGSAPSVAVSFDSRIKSDVFAKEAARVMAANGVKTYLYDHLMPTPCLSWAVRELNCDAGIMVTASHNPAKYNGYKVYGSDGCQLTIDAADRVLGLIEKVDVFQGVTLIDFDKALAEGSIEYIKPEVEEKFLARVRAESLDPEACQKAGLKVVYTPLNGTGNLPVRAILKMSGIKDVLVVPEQEKPDGTFKTCPFPNPEIPEALALGLKLCEAEKPDLLLATDPDCDRMGIAVPDKDGKYVLVTGNEAGALMFEYICKVRAEKGTMPANPVAVKTIVTTELASKIAAEYGVEMRNVLTGFKFIGEQIHYLEEKGEESRYIFGFEESYGYLSGSYVRDKDAVDASMLICEMAAHYKLEGVSILEALNRMYEKYGIYIHQQQSFTCEGASGMERMAEIMAGLRKDTPKELGGQKVTVFRDYQENKAVDFASGTETVIDLPKSDVLEWMLANGASVVLRPSGTEPKIKAYYTGSGAAKTDVLAFLDTLQADFTKVIGF